jgi:alpha-beta hydrolase superfamily lysophospholipase
MTGTHDAHPPHGSTSSAWPTKTLHLVKSGYHERLDDLPADQVVDLILTWIDDHTARHLRGRNI